MIHQVLPAFWCLLLSGGFWVGAGIYLDSSFAFFLGVVTAAGPVLAVVSRQTSDLGANRVIKVTLTGVSPLMPLDGVISLRIEALTGLLEGLQLDASGTSIYLTEKDGSTGTRCISYEVTAKHFGETRLGGLWVSRRPQHGLFVERHYVPIEKRWKWGLGGHRSTQQELSIPENSESDPFGEVRPWAFGDTRFQIDRRASQRTGDLMVRTRTISNDEPATVLVGPFDSLWRKSEESVHRLLSDAARYCLGASSEKRVKVLLWSASLECAIHEAQDEKELWSEFESFLLSTEKSFRRIGPIDPHFLREHLVASGRVNLSEADAPSAWIRWFERRFPGSSRGINAYWEANGTLRPAPAIRWDELIKRLEELTPLDGGEAYAFILSEGPRKAIDLRTEGGLEEVSLLGNSKLTLQG